MTRATALSCRIPIGNPPGLPPPTISLLEDGLDPDTSPPIYPALLELTLDEFLQHVVLFTNGQEHTVKDVIKFAANVARGVHHESNAVV